MFGDEIAVDVGTDVTCMLNGPAVGPPGRPVHALSDRDCGELGVWKTNVAEPSPVIAAVALTPLPDSVAVPEAWPIPDHVTDTHWLTNAVLGPLIVPVSALAGGARVPSEARTSAMLARTRPPMPAIRVRAAIWNSFSRLSSQR